MSDPNAPTPDPNEAVPGYTPPTTPEPAAPPEPPAYSPPAAPGGYEPPATPPAYEPPAATPPAYTPPPSTGGYEPPAPGPYSAPAAGGYSQPPAPGGGYPEPTGFPPPPPPVGGYGQPGYGAPGAYPGTGAPNLPVAPVGGAPLADWPKRALGGLVDYVAPGIVFSIISNLVSQASSGLGTLVSLVLGVGWFVYLGYKSGTTGVTFGRSITKTKLISEATGQPIGVSNGIVRQLAHIVDSIICYIGWLFPLWDAKKQTIADKLMKTVVIDNSADPNAGTYSWQ
jgi:uncharacterized RDD family membrane protein YckC